MEWTKNENGGGELYVRMKRLEGFSVVHIDIWWRKDYGSLYKRTKFKHIRIYIRENDQGTKSGVIGI